VLRVSFHVRFVGQPFAGPATGHESSLYRFLQGALSRPSARRLTVVTAWVKSSGLEYVDPLLAAFHRRGGRSRLITGVDAGIATVEGLRLAVGTFTRSYVVRDAGGGVERTFHPKVYLVSGTERQELLVGSSNLTAGGMWANYEASLHLDVLLGDARGEAVIRDVLTFTARLLRDPTCRRLDESLIGQLQADPQIAFSAESRGLARSRATGRPDSESRSVFGTATHEFATAPPRVRLRPEPEGPLEGHAAISHPSPPSAPSTVVSRWRKRLSLSDAQRNLGHRTHELKLTQFDAPIAHEIWFRYTLFDTADWSVTVVEGRHARARGGGMKAPPRKYEKHTATVNFDVMIDGEHLDRVPLEVTHAPARISTQSNVPTVLHWGSLQHRLEWQQNLSGRYVLLERTAEDDFRLRISAEAEPVII
jgi:hypothetical protein